MLLDGNCADGAVVCCLLCGVLVLLGNLVDDSLSGALVADCENLGAGALAETAADALFADRCLHDVILSLVLT